ncbi:MAG: urate hydroxylase PuuD [Gammaproteobacteria bacterium]
MKNPLESIYKTIILGVVLALILTLLVKTGSNFNLPGVFRWLHFVAGVCWIGLLYYFNLVQVPALAAAAADTGGPGGAGITKYVAPRALLWFRWAAVVTWLSGAAYLGPNFIKAFTLSEGFTAIGIGAWLGTIMLFNVWHFIWPNQKKILGIVQATDEEKAKARRVAMLASRTNTMLSIPMLLFMGAQSHGMLLG